MRVVISGIGLVTPAGVGKECFEEAVFDAHSGIGPSSRFPDSGFASAEVKGFDFANVFADRRFRRSATVTRYGLCAVKESLEDAGLFNTEYNLERAGLVVGVTHGAIGMTCDFHEDLVREGPESVSPALFSDSVLNAPTGNTSLAFAIRGPSHTIIGGPTVGIQALSLALSLIKEGAVDFVVVLSCEELSERVIEAYKKFRLTSGTEMRPFNMEHAGFLCGEGAAALVLESHERALSRGVTPVAEVCSAVVGGSESSVESIERGARRALKAAGVEAADISAVTACANGSKMDAHEGVGLGRVFAHSLPVSSIKQLTGESFGASTLMSVIASALSLKRNRVLLNRDFGQAGPEWSWASLRVRSASTDLTSTLVSSVGLLNEAAFTVLKRL